MLLSHVMENKKLQDIQTRINQYSKKKKKIDTSNATPLNVAIELVAGILVGLIMGIFFDNLFASKPLCLIICLMLSICASFRSIWNKYK